MARITDEDVKKRVKELREKYPDYEWKWTYSGLEPPSDEDIKSMRELGWELYETLSGESVTGATIYYAIWRRGKPIPPPPPPPPPTPSGPVTLGKSSGISQYIPLLIVGILAILLLKGK